MPKNSIELPSLVLTFRIDEADKRVIAMRDQVNLVNEQKAKLEGFIMEQKEKIQDLENDLEKKKKEIKGLKSDIHNIEEHMKEMIHKEKLNTVEWTNKFEKEQQRCAQLADRIVELEKKIQNEIENKEDVKIRFYEMEK
jgi:chromosome segregation ATPase